VTDGVVIFAAEGVMAHEAVETFARLDIVIAAAVVTGEPEWDMSGLANIVPLAAVGDALAKLPAVVPVWSPRKRRTAVEQAREAGFTDFMTVVDPTAVVARSARLGKGVYILSGANIGAGVTIGDFAFINRGVLIGHHCHLGAYVTTGGGVTVASRCQFGDGAVLGAGSVFIPNRVVGERAMVGAGAVVIHEVPARATVVGNPARVIKENRAAAQYPDETG
jgi:sugar O-acyltransferase (sialic acid O-acetyltransferase NeuD family)